MSRRRAQTIEWYERRVREQRQWIEKCGGSLMGYVARYGEPGEPRCYGNGGEAIWEADHNALVEYERDLELVRERRGAR